MCKQYVHTHNLLVNLSTESHHIRTHTNRLTKANLSAVGTRNIHRVHTLSVQIQLTANLECGLRFFFFFCCWLLSSSSFVLMSSIAIFGWIACYTHLATFALRIFNLRTRDMRTTKATNHKQPQQQLRIAQQKLWRNVMWEIEEETV